MAEMTPLPSQTSTRSTNSNSSSNNSSSSNGSVPKPSSNNNVISNCNNNNNIATSRSKEATDTGSAQSTPKKSQVNGSAAQTYFDLSKPLPKLPVPELQGTMDKYLSLIKTVVPPQDFARTKYIVDEFSKSQGLGHEIQQYILQRQQGMDNWANDWWLQDMYLGIKLPLLINSNPAFVLPYQAFPSNREQIRFAAKLVSGILDFKNLLDTRTLPVERCRYHEKGQPMCMEQHYRLFSSYREPGRDKDVQRTDLGTPGTDFIVVACKDQFYKVEVQQQGETLSESDICLQLSRVLSMAEENEQSPAVGVMTSLSRDVWAQNRERLQQDATNRANLYTMENCLFVLCLDKPTVPSCGDMSESVLHDMTARTHHVLHGQGVNNNTANRWMDKTVQVIVSEDGTCGINMEHSVAEGIALTHMIDHTFSMMGKEKIINSSQESNSLTPPVCLQWNLSSQSLSDIQKAKESVDRLVQDLELTVFRFDSFGRNFMKNQSMSPDAFIQLALQLTYYKIHGTLTSTYESASVRRYRQGRVDVVRANSPAALTWIKAMLGQTENTEEEKLRFLTEAVNWQQDYTLDTILGYGIDLHMLGLREAAAEMGIPTPDIFKDPSYKELNTFRLSTSQVPAPDYWTSYGAVVPDGYGCCYNPQADSLTFSIASFHSCPDTSSEMFAHSLESSLLQMAELCTHDPESVTLKQR